jgi:hypothetical protein
VLVVRVSIGRDKVLRCLFRQNSPIFSRVYTVYTIGQSDQHNVPQSPKVAVVDVAIAIDGTCDSRGCIGPEGSGRGRCYSN